LCRTVTIYSFGQDPPCPRLWLWCPLVADSATPINRRTVVLCGCCCEPPAVVFASSVRTTAADPVVVATTLRRRRGQIHPRQPHGRSFPQSLMVRRTRDGAGTAVRCVSRSSRMIVRHSSWERTTNNKRRCFATTNTTNEDGCSSSSCGNNSYTPLTPTLIQELQSLLSKETRVSPNKYDLHQHGVGASHQAPPVVEATGTCAPWWDFVININCRSFRSGRAPRWKGTWRHGTEEFRWI